MKFHTLIKTILITLFLTLFISACSSNSDSNVQEKELNAKSGERVDLVAFDGDTYSWSQISGKSVILINANTNTLSFIAPDVNETQSLVFEVQVISDNGDIKKESITVIVHPLDVLEDNEKTPIDTTSSNDNNLTTHITPTSQTDNNKTTITSSPLKSITLTISNNSLNINTNTTLNATAIYEDKTTKDVTEEVEWISTDLNAIEINKNQITAKKEKNIILQAKLNAITSNSVALEIYQEINGHRLPPEPNKTINDSTLLGIDVNNNGVRDDVERKIYFRYTRPIEQAYMMQGAKWFPQTLENSVIAAVSEKLEKENWNFYTCKGYLRTEGINVPMKSVNFMENSYFNTKERIRAYIEFNEASSGGVYHIPLRRDANKENCDFNITKMLELEQ